MPTWQRIHTVFRALCSYFDSVIHIYVSATATFTAAISCTKMTPPSPFSQRVKCTGQHANPVIPRHQGALSQSCSPPANRSESLGTSNTLPLFRRRLSHTQLCAYRLLPHPRQHSCLRHVAKSATQLLGATPHALRFTPAGCALPSLCSVAAAKRTAGGVSAYHSARLLVLLCLAE